MGLFGRWCATIGCVLAIVAVSGLSVLSAQAQGTTTVRVMTYNIKHGEGNTACEDPPATPDVPSTVPECAVDLNRAADVIRTQDPDIIAVQEVDRFWARSGDVDQAGQLAEILGMSVCFAPNLDHGPDEHGDQPHQYGVAILTKGSIISCMNMLFPEVEGWEQRGLLEARIDIVGAGEIAILATHFQAGNARDPEEAERQRAQEADLTAVRAAEIDVPVIVMGDLNGEAGSPELESLMADYSTLQDAWLVGGDGSLGLTIPASPDEPAAARIDFILVSNAFTVNWASVVVDDQTMLASDHYPVVADLSLPGNGDTTEGTPSLPEATPIVSG